MYAVLYGGAIGMHDMLAEDQLRRHVAAKFLHFCFREFGPWSALDYTRSVLALVGRCGRETRGPVRIHNCR